MTSYPDTDPNSFYGIITCDVMIVAKLDNIMHCLMTIPACDWAFIVVSKVLWLYTLLVSKTLVGDLQNNTKYNCNMMTIGRFVSPGYSVPSAPEPDILNKNTTFIWNKITAYVILLSI